MGKYILVGSLTVLLTIALFVTLILMFPWIAVGVWAASFIWMIIAMRNAKDLPEKYDIAEEEDKDMYSTYSRY